MKSWKLGIFIFLMAIIAFGCSKKAEEVPSVTGLDIEKGDKDLITQTITSPEVEPQAQPEVQAPQPIQVEAKAIPPAQAPAAMPTGELDRNRQIQAALKDANLYFGEIDGKIGPMTRKAIEDFQRMKNLKVDGKVGPITWGELQKYLAVEPSVAGTKKKR